MLITRGQKIAGLDAVALRDLLRQLHDAVFTIRGFADIADGVIDNGDALFAALEQEGLIEPAPANALASGDYILGEDEEFVGSQWWRTTVNGRALAKARIGKPMRREEAQRRLAGVISRAREVNRDPNELFGVETIELFGSLADPEAQQVGDIDLRVVISRRRLERRQFLDELRRLQRGNPLDAMERALKQLRRRLTDGSPKVDVQLDEFTSRPLPDGATPVVVYARDDDDAPIPDDIEDR